MKRLLTSIKQGVKLSFLRFLSLGKQGEGGKMEGNVLKILNCADLLSRLLLAITVTKTGAMLISNQSILKTIPGCLLEGLMLKLKLQ